MITGRDPVMVPLAVRFHNVARGTEHEGEGSDPVLWAPVDRDRRGRAGRSAARQAGAAAVRLHGALPRPGDVTRRAGGGDVARCRAALPGRGAGDVAVAVG